MLTHPLQPAKQKYSKLLVRPSSLKNSHEKPKNIFSLDKSQIHQDVNSLQKDQAKLNEYQVCGDKQFKMKFFETDKNLRMNSLSVSRAQINEENQQKNHISFVDQAGQFSQQSPQNKFGQTIYMNHSHRSTFLNTLNKTQHNIINRERQTLQRFKETQKQWQKIDQNLKRRLPKSETVTFGSVKRVYVLQNPQKLEIVNDMLPDYWRLSLRNNDKKLKSHIKGHKFKQEVAEEMLQTLRGTNKLQASIPRIGSQRIHKDFIDGNDGRMSLRAIPIKRQEGYQTMRQFHKNLHSVLNQTMRQRSMIDSRNPQSKSKFSQGESSLSLSKAHRTMPLKQKKTSLFSLHCDQIEELTEKQRKMYSFCENLKKLDKVDNQIYLKKFEKKSKWIHEGLEIGE